jgi:hypothetical protein
MAEIEMPPQYTGEPEYPDPKDTQGHVAAAARTLAAERVNMWMPLVLDAITEFESNANRHIKRFDQDVATFTLDPVLASFAKVVIGSFQGFVAIKAAILALSEVMDSIQSSYEAKLHGGLAQLDDAVGALVQASRKQATLAAPTFQKHLPEAVENGMTWVDGASTDPEYVSALCDWMGFPQPTRENTFVPVRQALENPFFGVYQLVRAQVEKANPQNPIADTINPLEWQREAEETQNKLFLQYLHEEPPHPEDAWDKIYQGVLPT